MIFAVLITILLVLCIFLASQVASSDIKLRFEKNLSKELNSQINILKQEISQARKNDVTHIKQLEGDLTVITKKGEGSLARWRDDFNIHGGEKGELLIRIDELLEERDDLLDQIEALQSAHPQ